MKNLKTSQLLDAAKSDYARPIWDGVQKHRRYLSDWDDNAVMIDSRADGKATAESFVYHLSEITIAISGELSIYSNEPIPLTNFPNFVAALKIAINSALRAKTTNHRSHVIQAINHCTRFFSFCIGKGIYNLSHVSRDLVAKYQQSVLRFGWWKTNEYDLHLTRFLTKIATSESLQKSIRREVINNTTFSLNIDELQKLTGLRIPPQMLPHWFYEKYREITKEQKLPSSDEENNIEPTELSCKNAFERINLLCYSHDGFDSIPFIAFPNPSKICAEYFKANRQDKRTKTLTISIAATIMQQAIFWLYDYGPTLLKILSEIREEITNTDINLQFKRRQRMARRIFSAGLRKFQAKHQLPLLELDGPTRQPEKLRILIITFQSALFFCIAGTTARRRNEISGEERVYGLYLGCLRKVQEEFEDCKVDFYIEKTLRDYKEFWAPKICVDAIKALEELSQIFRPLGSERKIPNKDLGIARADRLFTLANFKANAPYISEPAGFSISAHSEYFFSLCGIDRDLIFNGNRSIFRRFYCNLFVNRYDNPVAAALQHHLDHSHMGVTAIYGLDPHGRSPEEKSATLLHQEEADEESFYEIMADVSHKHHAEKIVDLLSGKPVGGLYARLILKLTARLSKDSSFALSPVETKAHVIADKMKSRGFASNENGHGMCMAGSARHTRKKAHCSDEDGIHPEIASPALCTGCINLMNPEGYQLHLANERDALLLEATDMTLPRALRQAKKCDAADIDAYLEADRRIADGNKQILLKLVDSWAKLEELSDE